MFLREDSGLAQCVYGGTKFDQYGRADDQPARYAAATSLNIRTGPGTEFPTLPNSPLAAGTVLEVVEHQGVWWRVSIPDASDDRDGEGWVHSRYLQSLN